MKPFLKGGLIGLLAFIIFFIIMSLINTGSVDFALAFFSKDPYIWINYIIVLAFILAGALVGFGMSKKKHGSKK